jgi:hypothetical protein
MVFLVDGRAICPGGESAGYVIEGRMFVGGVIGGDEGVPTFCNEPFGVGPEISLELPPIVVGASWNTFCSPSESASYGKKDKQQCLEE